MAANAEAIVGIARLRSEFRLEAAANTLRNSTWEAQRADAISYVAQRIHCPLIDAAEELYCPSPGGKYPLRFNLRGFKAITGIRYWSSDGALRDEPDAVLDVSISAWAAEADYEVGDKVSRGGSYYAANRSHTSATGDVANGAPDQDSATGWDAYTPTFIGRISDQRNRRYTVIDRIVEVWPPEAGWPTLLSDSLLEVTVTRGVDMNDQTNSLREAIVQLVRSYDLAHMEVRPTASFERTLRPWRYVGA